jgi:hypothetical protein
MPGLIRSRAIVPYIVPLLSFSLAAPVALLQSIRRVIRYSRFRTPQDLAA